MGEAAVIAARLLGIALVCYLLMMTLLARRHVPGPPGASSRARRYAFLVPCLDEELVIEATLASLTGIAGTAAGRPRVIVIDDDSADSTASIASAWSGRGVELVRRHSPDARRGKGAALNAGLAYLRRSLHQGEEMVVAVVDADGRLGSEAIEVVEAALADPRVGAVQLPVRVVNRKGLLCRFQDLEFVGFSYVFQAARHHAGTVGLGGNGQFARLSALDTLGPSPWSDCLAEDLELGLRLVIAGWRVAFGAGAVVSQQGVVAPRALLRQRARWIRGHFQCWSRVPTLLRAGLPPRVVADSLVYLAGPLLLMAISASLAWAAIDGLLLVTGMGATTSPTWPLGALVVIADGAALIPLLLFAVVYKRRAGDVGAYGAAALAAGLVLYNLVWYAATWQALSATALRRSGWAKTARIPEQTQADAPVAGSTGT